MAELIFPVEFLAEHKTTPAEIKLSAPVTNTARKWIGQYTPRTVAASAKGLILNFIVPANYSSPRSFRFRYYLDSGATGNAYCSFFSRGTAKSQTADEGTDGTGGMVIPFVGKNTFEYYEYIVSGFGSIVASPVADTFYKLSIYRTSSSASDTASGNINLVSVTFDYNADNADGKAYVWIPANAFLAPAVSGATLFKRDTSCVWARQMPLSTPSMMYCDFTLPTDYDGQGQLKIYISPTGTTSGSGNVQLTLSIGLVQNGTTSDPTFVSITGFPILVANAATSVNVYSATVNLPETYTSNDHLIFKIERDVSITGQSQNTVDMVGCYLTYLKASARQSLMIDMNQGVGTASLTKTVDTSGPKWLGRFKTAETSYLDFSNNYFPADFANNPSIKLRWRVNEAATGSVTFNWYLSTPAISKILSAGSSVDTVFDTSGTISINVGSAQPYFLYDSTITGMQNIAASDLINFRLERAGATDTCNKDIYILNMIFEYSP